MQYAEKCSQPYDFQICIIHLFLQGKLNNCSCSWSCLCISSLLCSALLPCWEPHREQTLLLWRLMEAWLWKFCLFGFFPLICDGFSAFITSQKIATCPCPAVVSQEKPLTWAQCEFSFLCPGKCSHSLGMRLPGFWRRKSAGKKQNSKIFNQHQAASPVLHRWRVPGQHNLQSRITLGLSSAPLPALHAGPYLHWTHPKTPQDLLLGSEKPFLAINI